MAQCPKCGKSLRLYHWRPECPHCGVNMVYYDSNGRLLKETEQAEIEHAKSQPRIDRLKAATIGSPKAIVRLILSVLPIGALFLPLAAAVSDAAAVNAVSVYKYVTGTGVGAVLSGASKGEGTALAAALLLLFAVFALVHLFCLTMALGKRGKPRSLILSFMMLACSAGAAYVAAANTEETQIRLSWGAYVFLALTAAVFIYEVVLAKTGLPVKQTPCYIGGLPSEEYFSMVEAGVSELEIRKKMVEALTRMQEEVFRKAAEDREAQEKSAAQS